MNLTALWSPEQQFQHKNGAILTNGKIYVYLAGRTELADIYSDDDGAHQCQNPVILDDNGRAVVFADEAYSYTAVVCDNYGQELFSFRPVGVGTSGSASSKQIDIQSNSLSVQKSYDETTDTETFSLEVKNSDCKSWIGREGQSSVIPADTEVEPLRIPATNEYDGHFIDRIESNERIYLKEGLYHVDCVIEFTQENGSEQNKLGQIQVFTGLGNGDESTNLEINETGPLCDDEVRHCIKQTFIRKVKAGSDLASSELYFRVYSPVPLSSCKIKSLSIVELSISGNVGGDYYPGEHVQITESNVINVTGLQPSGDYVDADTLSGYVNEMREGFYVATQQINTLSGAIDDVSGSIPSVEGLASEQYVDQHIEEAVSGKADRSEIPSLAGYATESYVQSQVSGKADKSEIPSLQGYATESWVQSQGYLTSVPDQYATDAEVQAAVSGKADKSEIPSLQGYATEQYVQSAVSGKQDELQFSYDSEDKITSIDGHEIAGTGGGGSTYSAGQYVSIQNDTISVTGVQPSGQYLVPDDLSGYATEQYVQSEVSGKQVPAVTSGDNNKTLVSTYNDGVGSYAWVQNTFVATYGTTTYAEIKAAIDAGYNVLCLKTDSTYQNSSFAGSIGYLYLYGLSGGNIEFNYFQPFPNASQATESNQGIAIVHIWKVDYKNTWSASTVVVAPKIAASSPLSVSYNNTSRQVTLEIRTGQYISIEGNVISVTGLQPSGQYLGPDDLNGYATTEDVEAATSGKADKSEIPSVAGLASEQYVDEHITEATSGKADVSAIPSLAGYATESWVNEQGYLTEVPTGYATVEDVNAATSGKMDKSQSADFYPMSSNPSGYLTEHQSLAGYATEQYVQSEVSGKQDELEFNYDDDQMISGINGSAIKSGDNLPEGVMNTSGLQYNAVGEISGYGESAIAQYGAEKQWLVHDDTIVHMSNSAQYAFGVNISATSQLMGIDETVLFEGSAAVANTSGNPKDYHKLEVQLKYGTTSEVTTVYADTSNTNFGIAAFGGFTDGKQILGLSRGIISSASVSLDDTHTNKINYSSGNSSVEVSTGGWFITKVVGIGRTQSN